MKKALKIIALTLVLVIAALIAVILFKGGEAVKMVVEKFGPQFTGAPVTLEGALLRPVAGKASLKGLVVSNPEGYKTPSAFELGKVSVDIDMKSLKTDTIVIKEILIDGPKITYEKSLKKSNIAQIIENAGGKPEEGEEPEKKEKKKKEEPAETEEAEPGKKVVIDHILVKGGQVRLSTALLMGQAVAIPLPPVELKEVGRDTGGTSIADAIVLVLNEVLKGATGAISGAGGLALDAAGAAAGLAADAAGAAIGTAGAAAGAAVGAAGDVAGAAAGAATDAVGDAAGAAVGVAGDAAGAAGDAAGAAVGAAGDAAGAAVGAAGDAAGAAVGAAGSAIKGLGGVFGGKKKDKAEE